MSREELVASPVGSAPNRFVKWVLRYTRMVARQCRQRTALTDSLNAMNVEELVDYVAEGGEPRKMSGPKDLESRVGRRNSRTCLLRQGTQMFIGGENEFGVMSVDLASLLASEVNVLATHATLRGIELERLSIEGAG